MGQQEDIQDVTYGKGADEAVAAGQSPAEALGAVEVLGTNDSSVETVIAGSPTAMAGSPKAMAGTPTNTRRSSQQRKGYDDSGRKRPSRKSNESATGQVPEAIQSIGAVAMPGIPTDSTISALPTTSIGGATATTSTFNTQDEYSVHVQTILVAKVVPDDDEMERRLQILEERDNQITVNAVAVEKSGIDLDSNNNIMGLPKRKFWCLVSVLVMISIAVIVMAVVLPKDSPSTSSPDTVAINKLWRNVGDEINKDGESWNTDPDSNQYQALDWLANMDQWSASFDGDIPTQVLVERYALVVFWLSTFGQFRPYDLKVSTSVCSWAAGITCDENDEFVTELNFTKSQLKGTIPSEVALLTSLVSFGLEENSFGSTLPTELGLLTGLNTLDVRRNELVGTIPTEFGQLTGLETLHTFGNSLNGTIPNEMGLLTNMEHFVLARNFMTGSIPSMLGNLTQLYEMSLERNGFTGTLPTELGLLTAITKINMYTNSLMGTIPTEIGLLINITWFDVGKNEMSGAIPTELDKCTALVRVGLQGNHLSGNLTDILCDGGTVFDEFWSDCCTSNVTCSCCTGCCG